MTMRASKAFGFCLLLALATTVPALAQPATPAAPTSSKIEPYPPACSAASVAPNTSDTAHSIYQAGKAYYDDANYDSAIQQFREAYKKDCSKHDLLIIISRSYEFKGDRAAAINALEVFLERVPTSPDAQQHRTRIENLKKQLAAQPPPPPAPTVTATAPPPPPKPVEVREHTVPPWIVVGLGGATLVAGVVVLALTPALPANCNPTTSACTKTANESASQFATDQSDAGHHVNFPVIGGVLAGGGGVLVLGGLLWHFLEPTGPVESSSTAKTKPLVVPQVSPGYAGLSLGGAF